MALPSTDERAPPRRREDRRLTEGVCRVHFLRNVLARIPKGSAEMVLAAIRTIFAQPDAASAREHLDEIVEKLTPRFPVAAQMLAEAPRGPARLSAPSRSPTGARLVHQPARAGQQGDQAAHRRGGHLPQRGSRHCASPAPSCSSSTTSGRWPAGATSPRARWRSLTGSAMMMRRRRWTEREPCCSRPERTHHDRR